MYEDHPKLVRTFLLLAAVLGHLSYSGLTYLAEIQYNEAVGLERRVSSFLRPTELYSCRRY